MLPAAILRQIRDHDIIPEDTEIDLEFISQ